MKFSLHKPAMLAAAAFLSACAQQPILPAAEPLLSAAAVGLQASSAAAWPADDDARWWSAYQDPQLDALIARALADSPSLAAARARIDRAGAGAAAAEAGRYPNASLGFDMARQRYTEHGLYPEPLAGSVRNSGTLEASLGYEWDLFGRHEAEIAAAVGKAKMAQAQGEQAKLLLAAQVARAYLALARVLAQADLLNQQIALRDSARALVQERQAAGLDNNQDVRAAESPLPELRRQALLLDELAAGLRHQLTALTAQAAGALAQLKPGLPQALATDDKNLSLDLLGRRPDVVAARWRVEASAQDVAAARALFYPDISLNAFAGFNSIGVERILTSGSQFYGFGPSLRLPLFDAGRLSANLRGSAADARLAVAAYNETLLDAVRDASDQLTTLASLQRQRTEQAAQSANAKAQLSLALQRFDAGLGNRLALLNSRQAVLAQERQALDLRGQTLEAQVALMRSLGGGWHSAE